MGLLTTVLFGSSVSAKWGKGTPKTIKVKGAYVPNGLLREPLASKADGLYTLGDEKDLPDVISGNASWQRAWRELESNQHPWYQNKNGCFIRFYSKSTCNGRTSGWTLTNQNQMELYRNIPDRRRSCYDKAPPKAKWTSWRHSTESEQLTLTFEKMCQ